MNYQDYSQNIESRVYPSKSVAIASVKRSKLSNKSKNRLLALVDRCYQGTSTEPDEPLTITHTQIAPDLDLDLSTLAIRILSIAVRHKITRQQIFDLIRERIERA